MPYSGPIEKTLFLVVKGVTNDTGGIDVKINVAMVGMSRYKCKAAAVVELLQVSKTSIEVKLSATMLNKPTISRRRGHQEDIKDLPHFRSLLQDWIKMNQKVRCRSSIV